MRVPRAKATIEEGVDSEEGVRAGGGKAGNEDGRSWWQRRYPTGTIGPKCAVYEGEGTAKARKVYDGDLSGNPPAPTNRINLCSGGRDHKAMKPARRGACVLPGKKPIALLLNHEKPLTEAG